MIPILFNANDTEFTTNGLGRLSDAISCSVTEERNGKYELEMQYPVSGMHYDEIAEEKIVLAIPADGVRAQPFRIYRVKKTSNGTITVYANHISYDLKRNTVIPFEAVSCADALNMIPSKSVEPNPFTFWTDKNVATSFKVDTPKSVRSILGGTSGSILDVYGTGEYEFDRYTVKLYLHRGSDNGVTLRYGKNITNMSNDVDTSNIYTGVVPFWKSTEGEVVYANPVYLEGTSNHITVPMDLSSEFDEKPTAEQLQSKASQRLRSASPAIGSQNLKVSYVALWQTKEYENLASLQRVKLCDTVTVEYPALDVSYKAKVVKTKYNVLLDRYDSIEIGEPNKNNMANVINSSLDNVDEKINEESSAMAQAIKNATELIKGGLGGYVVIDTNANGQPEQILIMDTDSKDTAVNVIRLNKNGIGFSTNGYNGAYRSAWTIDGSFVADFITTGTLNADLIKAGTLNADLIKAGTMNADRIKGGILSLGGANNINGEIRVYDKDGNLSGKWDSSGLILPANVKITWANVEDKPTDLAHTGDIPTKVSDLNNDSGFITAPTATQITKDTVTSTYIKALNLTVGNEIQMGADAKITWNNVTGKPDDLAYQDDIPTDSDIKTVISEDYINSKNIIASNIKANTTITNHISATSIEIGGDSTIQLGGNKVDNTQYIHLVGRDPNNHERILDCGIQPMQLYIYDSWGYSDAVYPDCIEMKKDGNTSLKLGTFNDGTPFLQLYGNHKVGLQIGSYADGNGYIGQGDDSTHCIVTANMEYRAFNGFVFQNHYIDIIKSLKYMYEYHGMPLVDYYTDTPIYNQ